MKHPGKTYIASVFNCHILSSRNRTTVKAATRRIFCAPSRPTPQTHSWSRLCLKGDGSLQRSLRLWAGFNDHFTVKRKRVEKKRKGREKGRKKRNGLEETSLEMNSWPWKQVAYTYSPWAMTLSWQYNCQCLFPLGWWQHRFDATLFKTRAFDRLYRRVRKKSVVDWLSNA